MYFSYCLPITFITFNRLYIYSFPVYFSYIISIFIQRQTNKGMPHRSVSSSDSTEKTCVFTGSSGVEIQLPENNIIMQVAL